MAIILNTEETFDYELLKKMDHPVKVNGSGQPLLFSPQGAGIISVNSIITPFVHALDMQWDTEEELILRDHESSDAININFQLKGNMYSEFEGIRNPMDMSPASHNLIFTMENGGQHRIGARQALHMLHLSIDKDFFLSLVGTDGQWSEQAYKLIAAGKAFTGIDGPQEITRRMMNLIDDIINSKAPLPVRNMRIQSSILELLSLQIEQFSSPFTRVISQIRQEDVDKLYFLKTYLDNNYLAAHTLTSLSRLCLLNEFKLKKGFKELFKTSVFAYLRDLRMAYAMRMLRDTSLTIDDIAYNLGYEYAHHFSSAFKKHHGFTPSQLRRS